MLDARGRVYLHSVHLRAYVAHAREFHCVLRRRRHVLCIVVGSSRSGELLRDPQTTTRQTTQEDIREGERALRGNFRRGDEDVILTQRCLDPLQPTLRIVGWIQYNCNHPCVFGSTTTWLPDRLHSCVVGFTTTHSWYAALLLSGRIPRRIVLLLLLSFCLRVRRFCPKSSWEIPDPLWWELLLL